MKTIQDHWKKKELPGLDCILFSSGETIMLDFYSIHSTNKKEYFINPICDTNLESIEKYNDDVWTEIETHPQSFTPHNSEIFIFAVKEAWGMKDL